MAEWTVTWSETHYGEVTLEADTEEGAVDLFMVEYKKGLNDYIVDNDFDGIDEVYPVIN